MHIRSRIMEAASAAIEALEIIESVTVAGASDAFPDSGAVVDMAWDAEQSEKMASRSAQGPANGALDREPRLVIVATAQVPAQMSALTFDDRVIAPIEIAIATSREIGRFAADWWLERTEYAAMQDDEAAVLSASLHYRFVTRTPAADPSRPM